MKLYRFCCSSKNNCLKIFIIASLIWLFFAIYWYDCKIKQVCSNSRDSYTVSLSEAKEKTPEETIAFEKPAVLVEPFLMKFKENSAIYPEYDRAGLVEFVKIYKQYAPAEMHIFSYSGHQSLAADRAIYVKSIFIESGVPEKSIITMENNSDFFERNNMDKEEVTVVIVN